MTVPWNEGIIGRIESFLLDRFPIGKLTARSIPSSLVSIALSNTILPDEWGDVRPNLWYFYVGRSGFAFKTPLIKFIRNVIIGFDSRYVAPPKFTPEGMTEYVMNSPKTKDRKVSPAHPVNFICRDEMSKLLGETRKDQSIMKEYLSELWDGYIEGYYTRSYQYEGNLPVYVVFWGASSEYFYEKLNQTFFTQGLGNRPLWLVGEDRMPKKLDRDFFFSLGDVDKGLAELRRELNTDLKDIRNSSNLAFITDDANDLWREFQYKMAVEARNTDTKDVAGLLKMKLAFNALKLSIVYSAGHFNLKTGNVVFVDAEDMERAIEDVKVHEKMWQLAMDRQKELAAEDKPTPTHLNDFEKVFRLMRKYYIETGKHIQKSQLLRGAKWKAKELNEILDTMTEAKMIKFEVEQFTDSKGRERNLRVYKEIYQIRKKDDTQR